MLLKKFSKWAKQDLNWPKKLHDPNFFCHIHPSTVKFHQNFESLKIFFAPPKKTKGKSIFWGNCAHTLFAPLHILHLFTAHTLFVRQMIISMAHSSFGQQFFQVSWCRIHIRYLIRHIHHLRGKILYGAANRRVRNQKIEKKLLKMAHTLFHDNNVMLFQYLTRKVGLSKFPQV